jgi:hypothetical protein
MPAAPRPVDSVPAPQPPTPAPVAELVIHPDPEPELDPEPEPDPEPKPAPLAVPALRSTSLHRVRSHRGPRLVAITSGFLGTVGLLLGLIIAAVNLAKWPTAGTCLTYATQHQGHAGFGCAPGSRSLAVVAPPAAAFVVTLTALAGIWIPAHTTRRRAIFLLVWAALLILAAGIEVVVYAKLPS